MSPVANYFVINWAKQMGTKNDRNLRLVGLFSVNLFFNIATKLPAGSLPLFLTLFDCISFKLPLHHYCTHQHWVSISFLLSQKPRLTDSLDTKNTFQQPMIDPFLAQLIVSNGGQIEFPCHMLVPVFFIIR